MSCPTPVIKIKAYVITSMRGYMPLWKQGHCLHVGIYALTEIRYLLPCGIYALTETRSLPTCRDI